MTGASIIALLLQRCDPLVGHLVLRGAQFPLHHFLGRFFAQPVLHQCSKARVLDLERAPPILVAVLVLDLFRVPCDHFA
jgi:hypothetical protein